MARGATQELPLGAEPDTRPYKTFRLAVSGDVLLSRLEVEIIDTPEFQRLRGLKQLGTTFYLYPSALHTRFEHSIGCLHMAETMMRYIEENQHSRAEEKTISPKDRQLVRLVALLHDVANIPYGHTLEDETCVVEEYQEDRARYERFVGPDTPIGKLLSRDLGAGGYDRLMQILTTKKAAVDGLGEQGFVYDLVKNTVCSDLLDYVQRDAYFCFLNLGFGERFLKYMYIHRTPKNVRRIAIRLWKDRDNRPRPDILSELIQLLQVRYYLGERVYFHHAKIISSAMLAKAVYHAMRSKRPLAIEELYLLGDDELVARLCESDDEIASSLALAVKQRRIHERFYALSRSDVENEKRTDVLEQLEHDYHLSAEKRTKTEEELADICGMDKGSVVIYCPDRKMNLKIAEMLVTWKGGVIPFYKIDDPMYQKKIESILESHRQLWQLSVFVDRKYRDNESRRGLLERWCRYTFEQGIRRQPNYKSLIKETLVDVARDRNVPFSAKQLEAAADHFVDAPRNQPLTRAALRAYVDRHLRADASP